MAPGRLSRRAALHCGFGAGRLYAPTGPAAEGRFVGDDGAAPLVFHMRDGRADRYYDPSGTVAFERVPPLQRPGLLVTLTIIAVISCLLALRERLVRTRRDIRESSSQSRASLIMTTQAALWLVALGLFGLWLAGTGNLANVMYNWPGVPLIIGSAAALVAAILSLVTVLFLPLVWRGGRRVDSWTVSRKIRFTVASLILLSYAALLATWGALEPWSR